MTQENDNNLSRPSYNYCIDIPINIDDTIIDMPQNVNDFNHNDLLSNIDPDINDNRQSSCHYFDSTLFNNKFGSMNNMPIFYCNIRSSSHNLSHLKNYLATLNLEFSIIGISENWGTIQNIDVQNIPGYSHKYCIRTNGKNVEVLVFMLKNLYLIKSVLNISYKTGISN